MYLPHITFCPSVNEYGEEEKGKYGNSLQAPLWILQSPSCSGQLRYYQWIRSDKFQGLREWRWSSFAIINQTMKVPVMVPFTASWDQFCNLWQNGFFTSRRDSWQSFDAHITNQKVQGGQSHVSEWNKDNNFWYFPSSPLLILKKKTKKHLIIIYSTVLISSRNFSYFCHSVWIGHQCQTRFQQTHRPGFLMKVFTLANWHVCFLQIPHCDFSQRQSWQQMH